MFRQLFFTIHKAESVLTTQHVTPSAHFIYDSVKNQSKRL